MLLPNFCIAMLGSQPATMVTVWFFQELKVAPTTFSRVGEYPAFVGNVAGVKVVIQVDIRMC